MPYCVVASWRRVLRTAVVDPLLDEGDARVRYRRETGWHPAEFSARRWVVQVATERRFTLERLHEIRGAALTADDQGVPEDLFREELIARDATPERSMRTYARGGATDRLIEDLNHPLKARHDVRPGGSWDRSCPVRRATVASSDSAPAS